MRADRSPGHAAAGPLRIPGAGPRALRSAAAERLGLSYEGIFRQATVYKGRSRDTAWFAAIDSEWPALDRAFRRWLDPSNFDAAGKQRVALSELTAPILVRSA